MTSGKIVCSRGKLGWLLPQETPDGLGGLTVREVLEGFLGQRDGSGTGASTFCSTNTRSRLKLANAASANSPAAGSVSSLIAGAAPRQAGPADPRQPTNYLPTSPTSTRWKAGWRQVPGCRCSSSATTASSWSATRSAPSSCAATARTANAGFVEARQQLLQRDAADAAKARAGGKGDRAAGAGRRPLASNGGVFNDKFDRRRKATEKRIERLEDEDRRLCGARPAAGIVHDGDLDARVALRLRDLTVTAPDGSRTLLRVEALTGVGDRIAILSPTGPASRCC